MILPNSSTVREVYEEREGVFKVPRIVNVSFRPRHLSQHSCDFPQCAVRDQYTRPSGKNTDGLGVCWPCAFLHRNDSSRSNPAAIPTLSPTPLFRAVIALHAPPHLDTDHPPLTHLSCRIRRYFRSAGGHSRDQ